MSENSKEIFAKASSIIQEKLGVDETEVTPTAGFYNDLAADSLDMVELTMAMEKEFNITIPDAEAEKIKTVQQLCDYISNHVDA